MKNIEIILGSIVMLGALTWLACADTITKKDDNTAIVSTDVGIADLRRRITEYEVEKAKWDDSYQKLIDEIQAQIDKAAKAGVQSAINVASPGIKTEMLIKGQEGIIVGKP